MQPNLNEQNFNQIDLNFFLENNNNFDDENDNGIVILTPNQKVICDELNSQLALYSPQHKEVFQKRMGDLKRLVTAIMEFPSLLSKAKLTAETRTPQDIIELLVDSSSDYGRTFIQLPSKATLGKGFLTAKLHTFSSLAKLAQNINDTKDLNAKKDDSSAEKNKISEKLIQAFKDETVSMMFLLLVEDVYLNLVKDDSLDIDFRRQLGTSLLLLWEHRADQNIADIAPVLTCVWKARRTLAPAFGTMMGTSELIMFSFQMDEVWTQFIRTQLKITEVSQAMEEFLFGISYEQIKKLKLLLREKGIGSIGRNEVSKFLGEDVKTDLSGDYKDFYSQYSIRRDNARARKRLNLEGPHRTLEDHFIRFVMEQNREKQNNDTFAK
ncbi:hypothetical protein [Treponema pectinovorum]|uniref:hypothetical protein n=1 Tax=Treponema pectinovorum TaxID=164 RepID=UPI0011CAD8E6|nr:hypothetical protein [Treponema pectinovorum]